MDVCAAGAPFRASSNFVQTLVAQGGLDTFLAARLRPPASEPKLTRDRPLKTDYWETPWGRLMMHADVCDPRSRKGKQFRTRFRVPFPFFAQFLLPQIVAAGIFVDNSKTRVPAAFKVLAVLRALSQGLVMNVVSELSHIPSSTCSTLVKDFCARFVKKFFADYVKFPQPGSDEMEENLHEYACLGVPGNCGSMDCTHVELYRCPADRTNQCKGKEGVPTLNWLCVCNHRTEFLYVGDARFGAMNDIQVQRNDALCKRLENGLLDSVEFNMFSADGEMIRCAGGSIITDGGFDKRAYLFEPLHTAVGHDPVLMAEWVESIRKDIECGFGQVKGRFRILRMGTEFASFEDIDNIFKTCIILHNMIKCYDGGCLEWEDIDWEDDAMAPVAHDDDLDVSDPPSLDEHVVEDVVLAAPSLPTVQRTYRADSRVAHDSRWVDMVVHFKHQWDLGLVQWPRRIGGPHVARLERLVPSGCLQRDLSAPGLRRHVAAPGAGRKKARACTGWDKGMVIMSKRVEALWESQSDDDGPLCTFAQTVSAVDSSQARLAAKYAIRYLAAGGFIQLFPKPGGDLEIRTGRLALVAPVDSWREDVANV